MNLKLGREVTEAEGQTEGRRKKSEQDLRDRGTCQEDQQMRCGAPRRSERAFQGPTAEDVPGLMKDTNKTSKKLNKL